MRSGLGSKFSVDPEVCVFCKCVLTVISRAWMLSSPRQRKGPDSGLEGSRNYCALFFECVSLCEGGLRAGLQVIGCRLNPLNLQVVCQHSTVDRKGNRRMRRKERSLGKVLLFCVL